MRPEAAPWWRQAEADLETAQLTLTGSRYYAASWFAQQAVEKGLKAIFIEHHGVQPPRTHDLEYLGLQMQLRPPITTDLATLNPVFDLTRYPDTIGTTAPVDAVSEVLASAHVAAAERVIQWLDQQLNPPSNRP